MRRLFAFSALVACCLGFGFIDPSFPNVFLGEPSTVSWDGETALPVSLTLLANATSGGWAVAVGIYNSEFTWTPWGLGSLDDDFVMLLVDGNGNSNSSLPFPIQDPNIEIIPVLNETDTLSTNSTASDEEGDLVLSPRSVIASVFQEFSLPAAASTTFPSIPAAVSTFATISTPSAMPILLTIAASFVEAASTTIVAPFSAAATTSLIPSLPAVVFSTETLSVPAAAVTDSSIVSEFAAKADSELAVEGKKVIGLADDPPNSTLTNTNQSSSAETTQTTHVRLAVAITIVVLLVFMFFVLIAFEYGKRFALRRLNSDHEERFRGGAELLRMNSSKGLRPLSLLRVNSDKGWEANGSVKGIAEPISEVERSDSAKGNFGRKSMKSIYEMA